MHQPDYSRAARVVDEMMARACARGLDFGSLFGAAKRMASGIRPVLRIWRATPLSRSSTARMICPSGSSFGLDKAFDLARTIADFAASTLREEKARSGKAARSSSGRADRMRPRPRIAGQNRARARPASHLLRLSRRGRRHEQHLGAQTPPLRDPAKSHERLSRHVGRRSRSGRANNHRHRKAQGRKPLQRHRQHPGLSPAQTAKSALKSWGWVIARASLTLRSIAPLSGTTSCASPRAHCRPI